MTLETWTGVRAVNITRWRRSIAGDLTAAFDFTRPDFSIPDLPDTVPLIVTSFAGTVILAGQHAGPVPDVAAALVRQPRPVVRLTLASEGRDDVAFTLRPGDGPGHPLTVSVPAGHQKTVDWPAGADGYYERDRDGQHG